jgi:hypothetical protein
MEGYDFQQVFNQTATLGFWFVSSATGTHSVAFTDVNTVPLTTPSMSFNYVTTFNVTVANTWQYITIPVNFNSGTPADWNFTNGAGMAIWIDTVAGINFSTTSLNTWNSGAAIADTSSANNTFVNGYNSAISQVSLVVGSAGLSSLGFSRAGTTIQEELTMCERYCQTVVPTSASSYNGSNEIYAGCSFRTRMRTDSWTVNTSGAAQPQVVYMAGVLDGTAGAITRDAGYSWGGTVEASGFSGLPASGTAFVAGYASTSPYYWFLADADF